MVIIKVLASAVILSLAQSILCAKTIVHRGAFHDISDTYALSENSIQAVLRAFELNLPAVELDLRLTSDNQIIVAHDMVSNRQTSVDSDFGKLNPVDVALGLQKAVAPINFDSKPLDFWQKSGNFKVFGRNAKILGFQNTGKIISLNQMLTYLKPYLSATKVVFLDIQNPTILKGAATIVKNLGLQNYVYLKFFAKKAINVQFYTYHGASTCTSITGNYNLAGLNIIPQFNDGELNKDGNLDVFGTSLTVNQYLDCWLGAQGQPATTATIAMVAASVPGSNPNAEEAGLAAMGWARTHNRERIAIIPNPDAGRRAGSSECQLFTWKTDGVAAARFDENGRRAKADFASVIEPEFIITDIVTDYRNKRYDYSYTAFATNLC